VTKRLRVVAAVVVDAADRVLLTERPTGKHMAGWWEFPGGKVADGESDAAALQRELREELAIEAHVGRELMTLEHDYGDRVVELVFIEVPRFDGEMLGLDAQRFKWVARTALSDERILEADRVFVERLQRGEWLGDMHGNAAR
jgi:8-oxo-dGTP diphosphatase